MPRMVIALLTVVLTLTACGSVTGSAGGAKWFSEPHARKLATAVARGDKTTIATLVADGADPDARGTEDLTMLQWSIMSSSADGMAGLLEAGADPDLVGRDGAAPLSNAAFNRGVRFVELLLSAGADPDVRETMTGDTPLKIACLQRDAPVFMMLLEAGADPDGADENSDAVIHTCARVNAGDLVLLLLQSGADPEATTSSGASFQDYYFSYPKNVLNEASLAQRATLIQWLEDHAIPVVPQAFS
ncbi:ankyrin repeat domain-containing protein [Tessaracoccus antarcticus]|uniref:Ankyrin repeat domain-containing protein n=1 Tax=Tessaracoccus antarcticus TaxID=2479848 RepID=A0A3M0GWD8_9ACTN|nr:ankyrin repeat domain-containing protein [Tessaracoccus antarcticus]RMB61666.1 ankyrin repeat domain-containing protein [Tessaracoccus antarcticus]